VPDAERAHGAPHRGGRDEADGGGLGGVLERPGERDLREARAEAARVDAEGDHADVVEREAEEHVLEVDGGAAAAAGLGVGQHGEQPAVHELDERAGRERAELGRVELEAGRLALPPPHLVVGAEDAVAEEVPDGVAEVGALGEAPEPGLEEVLQVPRVGGDHALEVGEPRPAERERAAARLEHAGDPLVHVAAEAQEQRREHADERPRRQALRAPLPKRVDSQEDGHGHQQLHRLHLREQARESAAAAAGTGRRSSNRGVLRDGGVHGAHGWMEGCWRRLGKERWWWWRRRLGLCVR